MPLVIILGMHRSGTSYIAQVLHSAGFNLGDDALTDSESDNLAGHWESQSAVTINDRILDSSGGTWCEPPASLSSNRATRECIDRFATWMRLRQPSVLKDPRITITFPVWRDRLRPYQLVACFRHPMAVARSLQVRQGWSLSWGLKLWVEYNRRLLDCLQDEPTALLFDFDTDATRIDRWFQNGSHRLGAPNAGPALQRLNPLLRHHEGTGPIADPQASDLYDQLTSLTKAHSPMRSPCGSKLALASVPPDSMPEKRDSQGTDQTMPRLVEDLTDVYRRYDHVLQQLDRRMREADAETSRQFKQQRADLRALERWAHERLERLADESANEHSRSETAYASLGQMANDHEAIIDRMGCLSRRCDQIEAAHLNTAEQLTTMLNELSGQLATCNQAFTAINYWLPLRVWRGLRKKLRAVRGMLCRRENTMPNPVAPAPHWVDQETSSNSTDDEIPSLSLVVPPPTASGQQQPRGKSTA